MITSTPNAWNIVPWKPHIPQAIINSVSLRNTKIKYYCDYNILPLYRIQVKVVSFFAIKAYSESRLHHCN